MMKLDPQGRREEDLGRTAKNCLSLLAINREQRGWEIVSLWFCKVGGDPTQSNGVKLA